MCEWLNKTSMNKFKKFAFFNLGEKFIEKAEVKSLFL